MFSSSIKVNNIINNFISGRTILSSHLTPSLTRVKRGQAFFLPIVTDSSSQSALQTFRLNPVMPCILLYINHHENRDSEVISHNQTLFTILYIPRRIDAVVSPCRGLGLTHLGQALQPGSSKTPLGVGGLFSVSPRPDRSSLCSHSKAAQAARTSDLFTLAWNGLLTGWLSLSLPSN